MPFCMTFAKVELPAGEFFQANIASGGWRQACAMVIGLEIA